MCECGLGSVTPQCDLQTGHCECQPGVQGSKCDQCQHGHWNLGPSGCQGEYTLVISNKMQVDSRQ